MSVSRHSLEISGAVRTRYNDNFVHLAGDESWILYIIPMQKPDTRVWHKKGEPVLKKFHLKRSMKKILCALFGILKAYCLLISKKVEIKPNEFWKIYDNFGGSKQKKKNESIPLSSVQEEPCNMIMPLRIDQKQLRQKSRLLVGLFSYTLPLPLIWNHQTTTSFQNWNNFSETTVYEWERVESSTVEIVPDGEHAILHRWMNKLLLCYQTCIDRNGDYEEKYR